MINPKGIGSSNFVPNLTSEAGLCITAANWDEVGIDTVAYSLESLLLKPGLTTLKSISNIRTYLGWSGGFVLNAQSLCVNKKGFYIVASPYDGSKIQLTSVELVEIIQHVKPDAVLLPRKIEQDFPDIWENWDDSIQPFLHADDLQDQQTKRSHGVYFTVDNLGQVSQWPHLTRYVTGLIDLDLMNQLKNEGVEFIESNIPAQLAVQGKVYLESSPLDLTDNSTEAQFELIDSNCSCPTCSKNFTKAYLHHLLLHTPLLCQRFLIQHNAFYIQQLMSKK